MKISILGTEYDYEVIRRDDDSRLRGNDGFTDTSDKTIRVASDFYEDEPDAIKNLNTYKSKVKRHEAVHAFLYESGLCEWYNDERLVDWIAVQFPKMFAVFKEIEAI